MTEAGSGRPAAAQVFKKKHALCAEISRRGGEARFFGVPVTVPYDLKKGVNLLAAQATQASAALTLIPAEGPRQQRSTAAILSLRSQ